MNINEFLNNVCNQIKYKPATIPISQELKDHIEDIKQDKISMGLSEKEAEEMAVREMGDSKEIGKKLNKIHKPKFEWRLFLLVISLILIRIFLYANKYISTYSWKSSICKDIVFIVIGLLIGTVVYFWNYQKIKGFSNFIFVIATGILIFQWLDWHFDIYRTIWKTIYPTMFDEKYLPPILNMRLWYISIFLYIVSFAGVLVENKKLKLIMMSVISILLVFFQSQSITNTAILAISYLLMFSFRMLQNKDNKMKNIIFTLFLILFLSISVIGLTRYFNMQGNSIVEDVYNSDFLKYDLEKESLLNNLKLFGETENTFFKNTNSLFLQILSKIGIIPSIILFFLITLMIIILIKDSLKIKDLYGIFLIVGLNTLYIAQFIIHILMNLNILLTSDINLPFISEGNLYFLVNATGLAIIMAVYRRKDIIFN